MKGTVRVTALSLAALAGLLAAGAARGAEPAKPPLVPFEFADIFFEFNATDNDAGVLVFLDGDEWDRLKIINPNGRKILDIFVQGALGELGLTELLFESGEPSPEEVLEMFPEGDYKFRGTSLDGELLVAKATLSHDFLDPPVFSPADGELTDPNNTVVTWDPVAGAVAYEVIVENEDIGTVLSAKVGASTHELLIPPTFLAPDTEYEIEILAIAANGNKIISESEFVTMP